ncbi:class I SAM-dependent methyltransferase [Nocardiopsis mangrovi]|uniref:Class I SAM-dependent methyltransferase n=1 Tax=Nocardiopsis mangrovi TaxID=1179818 RepID=A0ABV9DU23_9ACTN
MTEPDFLGTARTFYDTIADDYVDWIRGELDAKPLDRALLAAFAELARATGAGPVADVGCGPGRISAHLHALGVDVFGLDLSPRMVALARRDHPGLRFEVGSMTGLDLADASLGGIVAWYSIIHVPREELPRVFAEFHRVLAPGGHVLLAFQVGDHTLHAERPMDHPVALDFHRQLPGHVAGLLEAAGIPATARLVREPEEDEPGTKIRQGFLLARKPAAA